LHGNDRLSGLRGYIGLSLLWLIALAAMFLLMRRPAAGPIEILPPPTPEPTVTQSPSPTPRAPRVDVSGSVVSPGVYTLPPGSIVADAIAAAGGPAPDAELDRINKAAALKDGGQVYIPSQAHPLPPPITNPEATPVPPAKALSMGIPDVPVDINTATVEELDRLPGVGPSIARKIIDGRPYTKIEDLLRVDGIGQVTMEKLRSLVVTQ
jgi:competence protein ComEA